MFYQRTDHTCMFCSVQLSVLFTIYVDDVTGCFEYNTFPW